MVVHRLVSVAAATLVIPAVAIALAACGVRTPLSDPPYAEVVPIVEGTDAGVPPLDASAYDAKSEEAEASPEDASESPDVALPPTNLGNVLLASGDYQSGAEQTASATAVFFPSVTATGCGTVPVAGCTLETCEPATTTAPTANAGSIAITGGFYAILLQQEESNGQYAPASDAGLMELWQGGEKLVVTASGDTVPPFVGQVIAPTEVTALTPLPPVLSRAAPFAFSWLGSSAGELTVDLSATSGTAAFYLECKFDVDAGTGTVPAEALSAMPAGTGALTVSTLSTSVVGDGAWTVKIFAQTNVSGPTGAEYTGTLTIE
jgi:predicted small lipoprotein YifL